MASALSCVVSTPTLSTALRCSLPLASRRPNRPSTSTPRRPPSRRTALCPSSRRKVCTTPPVYQVSGFRSSRRVRSRRSVVCRSRASSRTSFERTCSSCSRSWPASLFATRRRPRALACHSSRSQTLVTRAPARRRSYRLSDKPPPPRLPRARSSVDLARLPMGAPSRSVAVQWLGARRPSPSRCARRHRPRRRARRRLVHPRPPALARLSAWLPRVLPLVLVPWRPSPPSLRHRSPPRRRR